MRLVKLQNGKYRLFKDTAVAIEGEFEMIRSYLLSVVGMDEEELQIGVECMQENRHDTACFGVNNMYTNTLNSDSTRRTRIELEAIRSLRRELAVAWESLGEHHAETKRIYGRLMMLYFNLNVVQALDAIGADLSTESAA